MAGGAPRCNALSPCANSRERSTDLDFQGNLGGPVMEDANGPSRGGDAALIEFLVTKAELISDDQAQAAQQRQTTKGWP